MSDTSEDWRFEEKLGKLDKTLRLGENPRETISTIKTWIN